jgi:hypothetical protein
MMSNGAGAGRQGGNTAAGPAGGNGDAAVDRAARRGDGLNGLKDVHRVHPHVVRQVFELANAPDCIAAQQLVVLVDGGLAVRQKNDRIAGPRLVGGHRSTTSDVAVDDRIDIGQRLDEVSRVAVRHVPRGGEVQDALAQACLVVFGIVNDPLELLHARLGQPGAGAAGEQHHDERNFFLLRQGIEQRHHGLRASTVGVGHLHRLRGVHGDENFDGARDFVRRRRAELALDGHGPILRQLLVTALVEEVGVGARSRHQGERADGQ